MKPIRKLKDIETDELDILVDKVNEISDRLNKLLYEFSIKVKSHEILLEGLINESKSRKRKPYQEEH